MAKTLSSALLTDLASLTVSQAMIITIKRADGTTFRLTNHDTDLVVDGYTYLHTLPFTLGAITTQANSGQATGVDNVELKLFCDGSLIVKNDFKVGLWDYAVVEIKAVNFEDTSHGTMWLRRGWFGQIITNEYDVVTVTITGMLKVLDFEITRTYMTTCDADFGDARCKFAIDPSQAYSTRNVYSVGDWAYRYDTSLMDALTVTNPGFEADGARTTGQAITGWTKSSGAAFVVNTAAGSLNALVGTYSLFGSTDTSADSSGAEQFIHQDIDLVSQGVDTTKLDAGRLMLMYSVAFGQYTNILDPVRLKVEMIDASGTVFADTDSGFITLDVANAWRDRSLVFNLRPNTRTVRLYLWFKKQDGPSYNIAVDDVRLLVWDIASVTPDHGVVQNVMRSPTLVSPTSVTPRTTVSTGDTTNAGYFFPKNPDFENSTTTETSQLASDIANALSPTIPQWTTTGSWWSVQHTKTHFDAPPHGGYALFAGDDSTSTQRTDTIFEQFTIADRASIDLTRVDLGAYALWFNVSLASASTDSTAQAKITIEQFTAGGASLGVTTVRDWSAVNSGGHWVAANKLFHLVSTCRKLTVTYQAKSAAGSGNNLIGFDNASFFYIDQLRSNQTDKLATSGSTATTWGTSAGVFTYDGSLIWRATGSQRKYDVVASVTDSRTFTATAMSGVAGTFETGVIEWLSGDNAGQKNLIRAWGVSPKAVKMYFVSPYTVQAGDRFAYVSGCQKRFLQDCADRFNNGINFRGFPYVPGNLATQS